jgi:hypothetical protein
MRIRRAIIIGHPGPEDRFLPGVGEDIANLCGFLPTPPGGGWRPEEITVLWQRTKEEILADVQGVSADYLLVYYSGHGAGQRAYWNGVGRNLEVERWLEVTPKVYIKDVALINDRVPRQLIICDCCRDRPPGRISGIPKYLEKIPFTKEEVDTAAQWFDMYIGSSPAGRLIVHATEDGRPAMDSMEGGMFSLAVLLGALRANTGTPYAGISIERW